MKHLTIRIVPQFLSLFLPFLFIQCSENKVESPQFIWTNSVNIYRNMELGKSCVDTEGNVYLSGSFSGTVDFDTFKLKSKGVYDVFLAKYDPNGYCIWAKQAGTDIPRNSQSYCYSNTVDKYGNVYISGKTHGSIVFDSIRLGGNVENGNIFLAKYSPDGKCLWANLAIAGGYYQDIGRSIAVDLKGNCYVSGTFDNWVAFDSVTLWGAWGGSSFITKYSADGRCLWAKHLDYRWNRSATVIATDPFGNFYITGSNYFARFDSNGNCLWIKEISGSGVDVTVDGKSNCYVIGNFQGDADFGKIHIKNKGVKDFFIAKYDSNGNCLWVRNSAGKSDENVTGISIDGSGNCFITGNYIGFPYGSQIFISKYDLNGNLLWVKNVGEGSSCYGHSISNDAIGNFYLLGSYGGYSSMIGQTPFMNSGYFISKLNTVHVDTSETKDSVLKEFSIHHDYTTPFRPGLVITVAVPYECDVHINIENLNGEYIQTFYDGYMSRGRHQLNFHGYEFPNGIYFYELYADSRDGKHSYSKTNKIILIK